MEVRLLPRALSLIGKSWQAENIVVDDNWHRIFITDEFTKDGKKQAIIITKHLAVAHSNKVLDTDTYKVYCISTNQPILPNVRIDSWDGAVELAQWIEDVYGDYLSIYEVYPDWDVLAIARLSMPKGEETFEQLEQMKGVITLENLQKAKEIALA